MRGCVLSRRHSNYRRIHHAHERISQLLIQETPIPAADLVAIGEALLERKVRTLNKASIRGVLRSLSMQRYIERWLPTTPCPEDWRLSPVCVLPHELGRGGSGLALRLGVRLV